MRCKVPLEVPNLRTRTRILFPQKKQTVRAIGICPKAFNRAAERFLASFVWLGKRGYATSVEEKKVGSAEGGFLNSVLDGIVYVYYVYYVYYVLCLMSIVLRVTLNVAKAGTLT